MKTHTATTAAEADRIRDQVRQGYSEVARTRTACCGGGGCASEPRDPATLARHIGYSADELAALPAGANLGLSCGNPTAIASLRPGESVLDLGSGGGFDVFNAALKVGPTGQVIGVDMTAEMISKARANAVAFRERQGYDNVDFRLGEIEHLPVADASIDVVLSNCVLNLSPDKPQVWRDIARVLKPGGRVAISDMALRRPLPAALRASVQALVGCVAGAALISEIRAMIQAAGLEVLALEEHPSYIEAMVAGEDPLYREVLRQLPAGTQPSDFITSLGISARRPTSGVLAQDLTGTQGQRGAQQTAAAGGKGHQTKGCCGGHA